MKINIIILFVLLHLVNSLNAQDVHFSQYYNTPMLHNVANTGLMSDADFRLSGIYRNQWAIIPAQFQTMNGSAEFQMLRNDQFTNWLGIGIMGLSDKAGDGNLSNTQFGVSLAYHMMLNSSTLLSFGMGAISHNRSIDFSKLSFDAQWDGYTFNKTLPNGEIRTLEKSNYFNVQSGINLSYFPSQNAYTKFGLSVGYINQPKVSLLGRNDEKMGMRFIGTFDGIFEMDNGWRLNPSAYYTQLQKASEIVFGSTIHKNFNSQIDATTGSIFTGIYYRLNESIISTVGIEWANMKITVGYDITASKLFHANHGQGGLEISIVYVGSYGKHSFKSKSPFECPRF